jgi:hypothetical protein
VRSLQFEWIELRWFPIQLTFIEEEIEAADGRIAGVLNVRSGLWQLQSPNSNLGRFLGQGRFLAAEQTRPERRQSCIMLQYVTRCCIMQIGNHVENKCTTLLCESNMAACLTQNSPR